MNRMTFHKQNITPCVSHRTIVPLLHFVYFW